jgi:DNA invertase Pin-like site-specific DNA recombinase
MMKAYAYLRVSGRGQIDGDGFERQTIAIKKYSVTHDIRIVKWFREEGICGENDLEHRPALAALVEALHADGVKLVLVENLGRFARDLMIQEAILHDLNRKGFQLVSVEQPDLCCNEPQRVFMRQVMGAFFQYEKSMIVSKLAGARSRMRAKEGRCEGRKPFGHYPGEEGVLNRMKELRNAGMTYLDIATELNGDGIKPRKGELWHVGVIHRILQAQKGD